jgi:transposase
LQRYAIWPSAFKACCDITTKQSLTDGLDDAKDCGIPAVVNFARILMIDIQAVRNAVIERWSNGQTESQINRLKTLKRAMFGRAHTELLRARLLPIDEIANHRVCG